jgi:hypothetical protein
MCGSTGPADTPIVFTVVFKAPDKPRADLRAVDITVIFDDLPPQHFRAVTRDEGTTITFGTNGDAMRAYRIFLELHTMTVVSGNYSETFKLDGLASAGSLWKNACDLVKH